MNPAVRAAIDRGAGFMGIHYAVEVSKGKNGDAFLKWMGGYFETNWSVNPVWTASITSLPDHPVARGVKPFTIKDEWYYHMRFVPGMVGVTPILAAVPPKSSLREDPQRGTNPTVAAEVAAGKPQVLAWAYERPKQWRSRLRLHRDALPCQPRQRQFANCAAECRGMDCRLGGAQRRRAVEDAKPEGIGSVDRRGEKAAHEYGI